MATLALRFFAVLALIVGFAMPAAAEDEASMLVVNLNTDDVQTSQTAFELARLVQQGGGDVVVYLNMAASKLANSKAEQPAGGVSQKSAHDLIAEIIAGGGKVFVCTVCMQQQGLSMRDRVKDVALGGQHFRELLMSAGTRVITF